MIEDKVSKRDRLKLPRIDPPVRDKKERICDFREVYLEYEPETAMREGVRCPGGGSSRHSIEGRQGCGNRDRFISSLSPEEIIDKGLRFQARERCGLNAQKGDGS
jgi:hypothetical protein